MFGWALKVMMALKAFNDCFNVLFSMLPDASACSERHSLCGVSLMTRQNMVQ